MKLSFDNLTLANFGSFLGEHELDLASYGPGLHFIRGQNKQEPRLGSNGVGKSTLWSALCWCLYGKTTSGLRNPDIQPRFGDKHTTVSVSIRTDDDKHVIMRTTHPNRLLLDDKEVGQDQIDQLLCMDYNTLTNAVIFGQGRPLFFDLEPQKKMALFGTVLNLDRWDARAAYASTQASALEQKEAGLAGELNGLEAQSEQIETLLEKAKSAWATWRDERAKELETAAATLKKLKANREAKETEKAGYDLAYDSASTEFKAAQKTSRNLAIANEQLVLERSKITSQLTIAKSKMKELKNELQTLGETDECPTCGQSLVGTNLNKHKSELRKKLKVADDAAAVAAEAHDVLTYKIDDAQTELTNTRKAERDLQYKAEQNRLALDRINPVIAELNAQIGQLEAGSKKQTEEANPYADQIKDLRTKRVKLKEQVTELTERLKRLGEQIERTRFWIKGFKEVRLYQIEDVLQELELTTNAALADIGLIDWQVLYAVEKETKSGTIQRGLNVFITSPKDKAAVRWECWSGGESQRLRLVGALALSEVLLSRASVEPNIEILDEPTRGLSPLGITDLCEYLADRAKQLGKQIYYADHQSVDSVRFSSVLTVVKTAKGSHLVSE